MSLRTCGVLQCPPCRSLTRVLVESYRKIKEAGQKFEILFVSADR